MLSSTQAEFLVKTARNVITKRLNSEYLPKIKKEDWLENKKGIFVTINTYPKNELRGCVGFMGPDYSLREGIVKAAVSASEDQRFQPLSKEELDKVVIDVSILSSPKLMDVKDTKEYLSRIEVGKHGLIIELMGYKGILLPQVPLEQNWDEQEFLEYACRKAGLPKDSWINDMTKVYTFESEVFGEKTPKGRVIKKELST